MTWHCVRRAVACLLLAGAITSSAPISVDGCVSSQYADGAHPPGNTGEPWWKDPQWWGIAFAAVVAVSGIGFGFVNWLHANRLWWHAPIRHAEEDEFLHYAWSSLVNSGRLFIECRSINDRLAYKGEVLSPTERIHGHYRRFIVKQELVAKIEELGFSIDSVLESDGLAVHGDDDPIVIRLTATKPC